MDERHHYTREIPSHFDSYHLGYCTILPAKNPHKYELHDVRIEKEKLGAAIALGPSYGEHAASGRSRCGGVRKEYIFKRP